MSEALELYDELHARGLIREAVVGLTQRIRLVKDFVSLIGSTVEHGSGNDIDILIRSPRDRHIETRIYKMFPRELQNRLHLVWEGKSPGVPHDSYIPLFDLCLSPSEDQVIVEMQATRFKPLRAFTSFEDKEGIYFDKPALQEFLEKQENKKWAVEQDFDGIQAIVHRKGDIVKIFSDQQVDMTDSFPSIAEQAKKLSSKDFIIDGKIILLDDRGRPKSREELMKFITAKEKDSDKNIRYNVFDILYFG